jgi:hypothetical protein
VSSVPLVLAAAEKTPEDANPLWYWLGIFVFLAVAVVLLWLSFRKQLGKIDFEEEPDKPRSGGQQPGAPTS